MKAIVLAGGHGTRLSPVTRVISKQLLPVYDKPMIYYPLSTIMLAGIRDILIITTPTDHDRFTRLLGTGEQWGIKLSFARQEEPKGIAEALLIGESFLAGSQCALILGDNIFHGAGLVPVLRASASDLAGARLFAQRVSDPHRYGVVELGPDRKAISLEEKPRNPRSNLAVTGLYFFDHDAPAIARDLQPSGRGELEITSLNQQYLRQGRLDVTVLGRGFAWLDTGTFESMASASEFVRVVQQRQGSLVGSPDEVAFVLGYIGPHELLAQAAEHATSDYGAYLTQLASES